VTPEPAPPEPDPSHVLRALGFEASAPPVRFEGGWDTLLWRFPTGDGRWHALRLYRGSDEGNRAGAAGEERALRLAATAGLPVPEIEAAGDYEGRPAFVQSWMSGRTLIDVLSSRPWRVSRLGHEFGRLQARVHRVTLGADVAGVDPLAPVGDTPIARAARAELSDAAFCHFDFHPLNVLAAGNRLTALLDFTTAGMGDRRLDLGITKALLIAAPLPPSPIRPLIQLLRNQFARAWEQGYRAEAGDFPLTPLFEAAGAAIHLAYFEEAIRDGRGWATAADVDAMRRHMLERGRAAGISR